MENHFSVLSGGKEVMLIDREMTVVTEQITVEKIVNTPVPLGICCQAEVKEILIASH